MSASGGSSRLTPSEWISLVTADHCRGCDQLSHSACCHLFFFFSSRRRHTRCSRDWSSDVCSSDLYFSSLAVANGTVVTPSSILTTVPFATAREEKYLLGFGTSLYQESENADLDRKSVV